MRLRSLIRSRLFRGWLLASPLGLAGCVATGGSLAVTPNVNSPIYRQQKGEGVQPASSVALPR